MYSASGSGYYSQPQNDLSSLFQSIDKDRSGSITAAELRQVLVTGHSHFSDEACTKLVSMFDHDHSRTINFHEFSQLFGFINQWRSAFQMYDKDRSGAIDKKEMEQALHHMGYRLSPQLVQTMVHKFATPTKKNSITFDNFIICCVDLQRLTNDFRSRDKEQKGQITIGYEDLIQLILKNM